MYSIITHSITSLKLFKYAFGCLFKMSQCFFGHFSITSCVRERVSDSSESPTPAGRDLGLPPSSCACSPLLFRAAASHTEITMSEPKPGGRGPSGVQLFSFDCPGIRRPRPPAQEMPAYLISPHLSSLPIIAIFLRG